MPERKVVLELTVAEARALERVFQTGLTVTEALVLIDNTGLARAALAKLQSALPAR